MPMALGRHLLIMLIVTLGAWIGWLAVIIQVNPEEAGFLGIVAFYLSLFLALFGSLSLLGITVRSLASKRRLQGANLLVAMRQALLWTFALLVALVLQSQSLLNIWSLTILIVLFIMLEFFLSSIHHNSGKHNNATQT